jgi:putative transposase
MSELKEKYTLKEMADFLTVSRSAFYRWRSLGESPKAREDAALKVRISAIFEKSGKTYGAYRISLDLKDEGLKCGKYRTLRLMKELNLVPKAKKKYKATTDSNHSKKTAPNLIGQNFFEPAPDRAWVGDITYVPTHEGWLYLAVVIDLFSRKVVGWSMSDRIKEELVTGAFMMAVHSRNPLPWLIFHSDRGSQYCSVKFRETLKGVKALQSMSGKGNCYDNAVAESFFHTLKVERLHNLIFLTRDSAKRCIFEYIEVFYNKKRRHSYINYLSPDNFENRYRINELENVA